MPVSLPDLIEVAVKKAKEGSVKHLEILLRHIHEVWQFAPEDNQQDFAQTGVHLYGSSGDLVKALDKLTVSLARRAGLLFEEGASFEDQVEQVRVELTEQQPGLLPVHTQDVTPGEEVEQKGQADVGTRQTPGED